MAERGGKKVGLGYWRNVSGAGTPGLMPGLFEKKKGKEKRCG